MLANLGAMVPHLGAMLTHLGPMLAHLGAYVGPSWGLCWPMTHPEPQEPKKGKTMGRAQNTVGDTRLVGGRGGGPSLLRRGEKRRTAMPRPGVPWLDYIIEWANARVPPTPL